MVQLPELVKKLSLSSAVIPTLKVGYDQGGDWSFDVARPCKACLMHRFASEPDTLQIELVLLLITTVGLSLLNAALFVWEVAFIDAEDG